MKRDTIDRVTERLVRGLDPEKIILFGSYAYGEPEENSDLDFLIVVSESDQPQYKRARQCYGLLRGIDISKDILVLTRKEYESQSTSPATLAGYASQNGRILYERPAA